jgi:hypothetical protein
MGKSTETIEEYAKRIVADWPLPSQAQIDKISILLRGEDYHPGPRVPSAYELEQQRKVQERADALKAAQKLAEEMTACDVCNLQPNVHYIRRGMGIDSHEWTPGRAEKIMKMRAAK